MATPKRDLAAKLHELVDALIGLTDVDRAPSETPTSDLPLLLNAVEAGRLLSISRAKVLDLAARGRLPSIRIDGSVRVPRDRLIAWIDEHATRNDRTASFIGHGTDHRGGLA